MSQIRLAPNASGSGTFTLSAPNSNSNRDLALPDAGGTLSTLGTDQTWQNVTGSRAFATDYTNTTGRPIQVTIEALNVINATFAFLEPVVGGVILAKGRSILNQSAAYVSFIVPPGAVYRANNTGTALTLVVWSELR